MTRLDLGEHDIFSNLEGIIYDLTQLYMTWLTEPNSFYLIPNHPEPLVPAVSCHEFDPTTIIFWLWHLINHHKFMSTLSQYYVPNISVIALLFCQLSDNSPIVLLKLPFVPNNTITLLNIFCFFHNSMSLKYLIL